MKNWSPSRLAKAARSKDPIVAANAREGLEQIKSDIKLARKYFNGYEKASGFDLRRIADIPARKIATMRKRLLPLRPTLASGFRSVAKPANAATKKALERFIGRKIPAAAKRVPVPVTPNSKVIIQTRGKRASVRVERKLASGAVWKEQTWYFADYHDKTSVHDLDTEEGAVEAYTAMMRSGDLPSDGWYVLVTGAYGNVGTPNTMIAMQETMARLFMQYESEPGRVEEFIGVRLVGFSYAEAMSEYEPRYAARIERKRQRKALKQRLKKLRENRV